MSDFAVDLDPDPEQIQECICGWRGRRRDLTLHPRQGFGVCPRCWRLGIERTTAKIAKETASTRVGPVRGTVR